MKASSLGRLIVCWCVLAPAVFGQSPEVRVVVGHLLPDEGATEEVIPSVLKSPFGVDFDARGNMIVVELEGGRVHRINPEGVVETIAGNGTAGYEGDGQPAKNGVFNGMHNVAVSSAGDIYISDTWNHCVRKIDARQGTIETIAGTGEAGFAGDGGPATQAKFDYVMCVTLSLDERQLYIADTNNHRIRVLDLEQGVVETVAGNGEKGIPQDGGFARQSPLVDPRAVAVDSQGRVYILERGGHALRMVEGKGEQAKIYTVAGNGEAGRVDGPGQEARFNSPKHLCVDDQDNVYIADEGNDLIRKYDAPQRTVTTVLGNKLGQPPITLSHPHGVCIENGALFVVDSSNNRILRVEP